MIGIVICATVALVAILAFLFAWRADRKEGRVHARALHDANATVRQEAFGALIKRAEAADTEIQRLNDKVTQLSNRVGKA